MPELVFIHGISQEGKDSLALKREWIAAWQEGLKKSGLSMPIEESQIRFPYYGDALDHLVKSDGMHGHEKIVLRTRGGEDQFVQEYLVEAQEKFSSLSVSGQSLRGAADDLTPVERGLLNQPLVQRFLRVLDQVPLISTACIAWAAHEAFQYLIDENVRNTIDEGVRQAFSRDTDTIVVGHSLGSIVAYHVLHRYGTDLGWNVPLFITLGSPLAVGPIKRNLQPYPPYPPNCVRSWLNALDPRDSVALWPLSRDHFEIDFDIENMTEVDNTTHNRHGIAGYLSDKNVAIRLYQAFSTLRQEPVPSLHAADGTAAQTWRS